MTVTEPTTLTPEQAQAQAEAYAASQAAAAEQVAAHGEQTAATEPAVEGAEPKVKRGTPTYAVEAVDGLPEQKRGTLNVRDRKTIYVPLLSGVAQEPGQWFAIATYTSLTGARSAAKALTEDIARDPSDPEAIPLQGGTIEFETRRRVQDKPNPDNNSVLYARFVLAEG